MDPEAKKFGRGPRELTGAVDLISHYKLLPHHDFFCKRALPISISETHYLHNVVGDTEIRKGEGMELDQLFENHSYLRETTANIRPFDLDTLRQAFQLRETAPIELPSAEKGLATISGKVKYESKDKERKHKKHKDKDREKDKEHKKHKHRHKDRSKDKDKDKDKDREKKDKSGHHDSGGSHSKKHHDKKRKHDGSEDLSDTHKHKKNKEFCRPGLSMDPAYLVSQPDSNMLWMQIPPGLNGGSNQTEPLIGVTANRDISDCPKQPSSVFEDGDVIGEAAHEPMACIPAEDVGFREFWVSGGVGGSPSGRMLG